MTMRESENDTEMNKFISIHKYVNWITNFTQNTSVSVSTSLSYSNVETSTPLTYSSSTQTFFSQLSTLSAENSSSHSNVENTNQRNATTENSRASFLSANQNFNTSSNEQSAVYLRAEKRTTSNVGKTFIENEKESNSEQSKGPGTDLPTAATTLFENTKTLPNFSQTVSSAYDLKRIKPVLVITTEQDESSNIQVTTSSYLKKSGVGELTFLPIEQSTVTSNSTQTEKSQSSEISTPSVTYTTPQNLISTVETKMETSSSLVSTSTDLSKTKIKTLKETTTKVVDSIPESTANDIRTKTGLNTNIDQIVEIPEVIASNLKAVYNSSIIPRFPEGRDLKDFSNNVSQAIESLSTLANRLPSNISTTRNPIEDDIITKTPLESLNSSFNIVTEANTFKINSTESNDNSTTTISSEDVIIGGFEFTPAMIITGVCVASLLVLFIIFGLLSLSKPVTNTH